MSDANQQSLLDQFTLVIISRSQAGHRHISFCTEFYDSLQVLVGEANSNIISRDDCEIIVKT
jgi:hypothetical protein